MVTMAPLVAADTKRSVARTDMPDRLYSRYEQVRRFTNELCEPLATEDYVVQSMPDVSPTKWHLAHTTWFFENFVLQPHLPGYTPLNPRYAYLFNSYYVQAGERHCRAQRGYLSRPTVAEVMAYRTHVDGAIASLLAGASSQTIETSAPIIELGLHHEQQHQELVLTDIKHVFSVNPLRPVYRRRAPQVTGAAAPLGWVVFEGGLVEVGFNGRGFSYDNESPRHRYHLEPFALADRLITCGEYLEFMNDGGYQRAELWLSMGWAAVQQNGWTEPFYWENRDGAWCQFTLAGMREIDPDEPVTHVSYFEADAFARWKGARLPLEQEWEAAAATVAVTGNFVEQGRLHPAVAPQRPVLKQMFGDAWEWTQSHYSPYPGYQPPPGALGEYNGKFMCNQFVLRGGSCATPQSHIRATYRNFFPADTCWQFTGIRLARKI